MFKNINKVISYKLINHVINQYFNKINHLILILFYLNGQLVKPKLKTIEITNFLTKIINFLTKIIKIQK